MAYIEVKTEAPPAAAPGAQRAPAAPAPKAMIAAASPAGANTPHLCAIVWSFAALVATWLIAIAVNQWLKPPAFVVPAGISVFALLYAVTQGLERLLEPLSNFLVNTNVNIDQRNQAVADLMMGPDDQKARIAARAQADLDRRRADKMVVLWAVASILGMLLAAAVGLYLLNILGMTGDGIDEAGTWQDARGIPFAVNIRHAIDLLITGLAIGGGTKPLHDLISNLQASKQRKTDPQAATPSPTG